MENKILYDHKSRAPDHIISLEKYNWQTNLEQKNTLQLGILSWVLEKTTWKLPEVFWCLFFFQVSETPNTKCNHQEVSMGLWHWCPSGLDFQRYPILSVPRDVIWS